jgi:hypothetical protein
MEIKTDINSLIMFSRDLSELSATIQDLQSSLYSDSEFVWPINRPLVSNLRNFLEGRGVNVSNPSEIENSLKDLNRELSELPVVRVKVAVKGLSEEFWKKTFFWIRENVKNAPFLLARDVDSSILGGIVLYLDGNYIDLSLRSRLEQFFEKESAHVSR